MSKSVFLFDLQSKAFWEIFHVTDATYLLQSG